MRHQRVIISGGGTGGHIYPALAIANGLKLRFPEMKFLFVGAKGKMEMEKRVVHQTSSQWAIFDDNEFHLHSWMRGIRW